MSQATKPHRFDPHKQSPTPSDSHRLTSSQRDAIQQELDSFQQLHHQSYLGTVRHNDNREHLGARGWLQLVCTKWRTAVLGHPNLWTRVDVVGPFDASTVDSYLDHIDLADGSLLNTIKRLVRTVLVVTELVVDGYRWFDPNFKKTTQILDSVSLEEEEVPSQDVYQPRSLTHLILHGPVPLHALKRVQFLALQEVVIQPNDDGAHLFQQCSEQYPFDFGSLPVLRLECQPGTLFWHLGEQYEDFCLFRDEIIPSAFGKFQDAETVSASGCIWRSFAWIFDAWDLEFATGANKGCDETHSISMVRVRATMNNKTIGNGENWMPPSESDGDYERNSDW
ncbi:hypothetical protein CPB86DRAFT_790479 [Serendipita vermifera]|nr:hypothetical protein CPB86DRAFT_790479 [Serendipita vermifera]